jgi:hypothetical protein
MMDLNNCSMVVVFGRPGAGKTTISNEAFKKLKSGSISNSAGGGDSLLLAVNEDQCLLLDLDVCVPNWMKENFAKGLYPTLEQRHEFAIAACDYVQDECNKVVQMASFKNEKGQQLNYVIVSFSFVNTDLREIFRSRFPLSKWALVDVDDSVAQDRIEQREGHFYKGPPSDADRVTPIKISLDDEEDDFMDKDNSEWMFAPVTYDHIVLNGLQPIQDNADQVIKILLS